MKRTILTGLAAIVLGTTACKAEKMPETTLEYVGEYSTNSAATDFNAYLFREAQGLSLTESKLKALDYMDFNSMNQVERFKDDSNLDLFYVGNLISEQELQQTLANHYGISPDSVKVNERFKDTKEHVFNKQGVMENSYMILGLGANINLELYGSLGRLTESTVPREQDIDGGVYITDGVEGVAYNFNITNQ